MYNFAQISLPNSNGPYCPDYADQAVFLANIWFVMLIACVVLSVVFFILKQTKFGALFVSLFLALVLAKLLMPIDECNHGGLFSSSGTGLVILGIFAIVLVISCIWGSCQLLEI